MTTTAAPNRLSQLRAAEAAAVAALASATASVEQLPTRAIDDALLAYERACAAYAARVRLALREAFDVAASTAVEVGALAAEIAAAFAPEEAPETAPDVPATTPEPAVTPEEPDRVRHGGPAAPPWGTDGIDDADLGAAQPGQRFSPGALGRMAARDEAENARPDDEAARATPPPAPQTRRAGRRKPARPAPAVPLPSTNGDRKDH